jgi:hypothetical protein
VPGQPPANVEYNRRKDAPFHNTLLVSAVLKSNRSPKRVKSSLFRALGLTQEGTWRGKLKFDDPPLQADHGRLGSVAGAQFGKDVLDSSLYGFFSDRELIGNLLIGIAGRDQPEHVDFCGR